MSQQVQTVKLNQSTCAVTITRSATPMFVEVGSNQARRNQTEIAASIKVENIAAGGRITQGASFLNRMENSGHADIITNEIEALSLCRSEWPVWLGVVNIAKA